MMEMALSCFTFYHSLPPGGRLKESLLQREKVAFAARLVTQMTDEVDGNLCTANLPFAKQKG